MQLVGELLTCDNMSPRRGIALVWSENNGRVAALR